MMKNVRNLSHNVGMKILRKFFSGVVFRNSTLKETHETMAIPNFVQCSSSRA
jgi:hypothetical protein